jgi:hypothetical protein
MAVQCWEALCAVVLPDLCVKLSWQRRATSQAKRLEVTLNPDMAEFGLDAAQSSNIATVLDGEAEFFITEKLEYNQAYQIILQAKGTFLSFTSGLADAFLNAMPSTGLASGQLLASEALIFRMPPAPCTTAPQLICSGIFPTSIVLTWQPDADALGYR